MPKEVKLLVPELAFIIGTRVASGVGIGLLAADRMKHARRRRTAWTLLAIGAATTGPIIMAPSSTVAPSTSPPEPWNTHVRAAYPGLRSVWCTMRSSPSRKAGLGQAQR